MTVRMGIITVRDAGYHPNRRLIEATHQAGHKGNLIHPYRLWPTIVNWQLGLTGEKSSPLPHVVLPRQGAQIGDASLALIRQFQLMGIPLVNDLGAVTIARNKFLTQQVLTAAGLPCPDTVFVNEAPGFFHAVDQLGGYPVVVKQVSGRQGDGVLRIMDPADARQRVLSTLDRRRGLMIQRYLPPENREDIRALVIGGELICAATLTPVKGDFRANFHLGSYIKPTVLSTKRQRIAIAAAAAVGCDIAGVDMMVSADGYPLVVEVNYSPGFKGMEAATGLDIATRMIQFAVDRYREKQER
ncbi:MAG: RimK family alpha-L-glutamate ligase [Desulfosarcina sp.]|nr:RimK family alpha-L-glutamate ligase [Desulfosarcina sp.]MBC2741795.1 RimK family alpha-L-glutamate ligase [Desulfosarcina sp.]MBC2764709.1 RimK family alpha-L-glutamate ligase [Desulfosarcina sp.]